MTTGPEAALVALSLAAPKAPRMVVGSPVSRLPSHELGQGEQAQVLGSEFLRVPRLQ